MQQFQHWNLSQLSFWSLIKSSPSSLGSRAGQNYFTNRKFTKTHRFGENGSMTWEKLNWSHICLQFMK